MYWGNKMKTEKIKVIKPCCDSMKCATGLSNKDFLAP